ncbi:MAG TPA: hypothetical protein VFE58_01675 [Tepidisphaeraceae bacterium]|jgi:hypothetical protein|nr:hypothetical protein [Tepidisphaeraceae bacterium]
MTRAATGDTIVLRPQNNIYTVLLGVATLVVVVGLLVVWMRSETLFGKNPFM